MKPIFLKETVSLLMVIIILSFISCMIFNKPQPIPQDKEAFIGVWLSRSGFTADIKASGIADLTMINNSRDIESIKLDIGVTPEYAKNMLVTFGGDSTLIICKPTVRAREYRIDRTPFIEGNTSKLILNGVLLVKQQ